MSTHNPKRVAGKLQRVIDAWKTLRPTKTFAGMTLEQFQTKVQPSLDARNQLATAQTQAKEHRANRQDSDAASLDLAELVVNAVKGDPEERETSGVYAAMGYVPKNERQSGLTRKGQTAPPVASAMSAK